MCDVRTLKYTTTGIFNCITAEKKKTHETTTKNYILKLMSVRTTHIAAHKHAPHLRHTVAQYALIIYMCIMCIMCKLSWIMWYGMICMACGACWDRFFSLHYRSVLIFRVSSDKARTSTSHSICEHERCMWAMCSWCKTRTFFRH